MKRIIFLLIILISSCTAHAFHRPVYEDATIVQRSELIIVGHIKKGSIEYVPHKKRNSDAGASWEYHVILSMTEVLKGQCEEKEIPIIIHYGLTPVVGGYEQRGSFTFNPRGGRTDYPEDIIEIFDTGNSALSLTPLTSDSGKDNLWFLCKRNGEFGREIGEGPYGITDPEEHQSIEWKNYFLCYLSDTPEKAVKDWATKNPDRAERAQNYLDHLEVQRILKIEDTNERFEKLLPYFLKRNNWNMQFEAKEGILSCGEVAGDYFLKVFDKPEYKNFHQDIILLWRDMKYEKCIPFLINLLEKHDQFWAQQELKTGWWNNNVGTELTRTRREIYIEVYYGINTLRSFHDFTTRDIIELTRKRWHEINFDNTQIVEECDAALRDLSEES